MEYVVLVYAVIAGVLCLVGYIDTVADAEHESTLNYIFYLQITIVKILEDEINLAGIIIVLIVASAFLIPYNVIMVLVKVVEIVIRVSWMGFKKAFRKKGGKRG